MVSIVEQMIIPCFFFFMPTENVPMILNYIFFQCAGSDEQLGKLVYNALETATGNFVLLYEWVLQWHKKMGPFLTSQEKEKIDKCKKQVGIQDGSLSKRTHVALKATTKPSNSAFGWLANTTQNAMRSVQPEGMVEDHKCSQTLLPLSEVSEHGPDSCRCFSTSFLSSYYSINSSLSPTGTKEHFITVLFAIICIFSVSWNIHNCILGDWRIV